MNLQQLRRRQIARTLEHARIWAPDRFDVSYEDYWDGDDDDGPTPEEWAALDANARGEAA